MPSNRKTTVAQSAAFIGFEGKLWLAADKLPHNMDAEEPSAAKWISAEVTSLFSPPNNRDRQTAACPKGNAEAFVNPTPCLES
jgi:hypothetical protein